MKSDRDVVITGIGIVSPIGTGVEAVVESIAAQKSGIRPFEQEGLAYAYGGSVPDFEPKKFVKPRKNIKVMSRDIQLGTVAAGQACEEANFEEGQIDPERMGVVFGSEMIATDLDEMSAVYRACIEDKEFQAKKWGESFPSDTYPLWMLKYLPNMAACHVGISQDARGPNNSLTMGDVSALLAIIEAASVLTRGMADVMITGAVGRRIAPIHLVRWAGCGMLASNEVPEKASRPFDADRNGMVTGEGAGALVLETRETATRRGAKPIARLAGYASTHEPTPADKLPKGKAIRRAITESLKNAGISADQISHVNANAMGMIESDRVEAQAIRDVLGDVPVTAPKSFFGHLGAGSGTVELLISLISMREGKIPPTLNYETPDADCPVNIVTEPTETDKRFFMTLSDAPQGQAIAMIFEMES